MSMSIGNSNTGAPIPMSYSEFMSKGDVNQDGGIDASEFSQIFKSQLDAQDDDAATELTNQLFEWLSGGDDTISSDDIAQLVAHMDKKKGHRPPKPMEFDTILSQFDLNKDGYIDSAEFQLMVAQGAGDNAMDETRLSALFDEISQGDGQISLQDHYDFLATLSKRGPRPMPLTPPDFNQEETIG